MNFTKQGEPNAIKWEAVGLQWLRQAGGAAVVEIISLSNDTLVEQQLQQIKAKKSDVERFAYDLATTHAAGAERFGSTPPVWDDTVSGYIGMARLATGEYEKWGEFYAESRLLPHAKRALSSKSFSKTGMIALERLCERLRDGEFDDGRAPARVHGDLWAGNVIPTANGLVMIDPAAHGGHGETDLAMLALFGYPQLSLLQEAYAAAADLASGWQERIGLHQLWPLLVHAELFGGSYGTQAEQTIKRYQ